MIETQFENGLVTLAADGRVDGTNAKDFQQEVEAAIEQAERGVLVDMTKLSYISSAGLRAMLLVAKALDKRNVKFALYGMSEQIRDVFKISGFDKIISVCDSRADAMTLVTG